MLDGQPHGNGSIVYLANDKFGRANYTGLLHNILRGNISILLSTIFQYIVQSKLHRSLTQYFDLNFCITYYSGEWRFGTITGVGTMHWKSGAR